MKKREVIESESVGVSVRLPRLLVEWLDKRATEEHRTRGNLIRMLLDKAMETSKHDQ